MRYRIVSDRCTLGPAGRYVDLDDAAPGVNVRALVRARILEPAPVKKKKTADADGDVEVEG